MLHGFIKRSELEGVKWHRRNFDGEFKIQGVKLRMEIGFSKDAKELSIDIDLLYGWNKRAKDARLD